MSNAVTLEHAKLHLEDLVAGAGRHEEWLIVGADGEPVATLTAHPVVDKTGGQPNRDHIALFGLMKGMIEFPPGWDDPLEEFKPYTE